MKCRKSFWKAVPRDGGGLCLLRLKCRGPIDDNGRCEACGARFGDRSSRPLEKMTESFPLHRTH